MNKILFLGSTGFIGSHLFKEIKASCENRLMVVLHKNFKFSDFESSDTIVGDFTSVDLDHFKRFRPDSIFHLGRIRGNGVFGRLRAANKGKNGNKRIIKYLSKNNLNPRIFYFSGTLVYGNKRSENADEKSTIDPTSYSKEYFIAEKPWYEESIKLNANISMFRLPWVVGKGSWFYHHYVQIAFKKGFVPLYSKGENWMSLIDVHDCCSLAHHISRKSEIFKIVNLYNPNLVVRQTEFVEMISEVLNRPIKRVLLRKTIFRDNAFNQAMGFSLKVNSIYTDLYDNFQFKINDLKTLIEQNIS